MINNQDFYIQILNTKPVKVQAESCRAMGIEILKWNLDGVTMHSAYDKAHRQYLFRAYPIDKRTQTLIEYRGIIAKKLYEHAEKHVRNPLAR